MNRTKIKKLIVGTLMVLVLLWIIIPPFMRSRSLAHQNSCINHLVQIDGAKQQWAKDNNKNSSDVPKWNDLKPYFGNGRDSTSFVCPDGGSYTLGKVSEAPKCSIPGHELN
jgi:hypothetical protein